MKNDFTPTENPIAIAARYIIRDKYAHPHSWVGSLPNLPFSYCSFQWLMRPPERLCLRLIWARVAMPLNNSSTTWRLYSLVNVRLGFMIGSFLPVSGCLALSIV